jgi:L-malate glycosyltransferase
MGKAAVKLLSNEKLHAEMSANARRRAEDFEQNKIVAMYEQHYIDVLEKMKEKAAV